MEKSLIAIDFEDCKISFKLLVFFDFTIVFYTSIYLNLH